MSVSPNIIAAAPAAGWLTAAAAIAVVLAGASFFKGRRSIRHLKSPRQALKNAPLAYARFGFPGYKLLDCNQAFVQMSALAGGNSQTSLAESFPEETTRQLSEWMDTAAAEGKRIASQELYLQTAQGGNAVWSIDIIPARWRRQAIPMHVTMFAGDITEQALRLRIRQTALRINSAVMSSLDVNETIRIVLEGLAYIVGADAGVLFLLEDEQWERRARYGAYENERDPTRLRVPYDALKSGVEAIETQQILEIENAAADGRIRSDRIKQYQIKSSLVVPLISGRRPIGAAWLNQTAKNRAYSKEQVEFASVIGSHGALAIENAAVYQQERLARESLEAIEAISEAGLASLDIETVLSELVERARHFQKMDAAVIFLLDENRRFLEHRASSTGSVVPVEGRRIEMGEGLLGRAAAEETPRKIDDLQQDGNLSPFFRSLGMRSALAVPLKIYGVVEGVLGIGNRKRAAFSASDWELIQVIADRASLAVQNSMLHSQTLEELSKATLLRDVAAACAGSSDLIEISRRALEAIAKRLGCRIGSIYYLDKERQALVNLAFSGPIAIHDHLRVRRLDEGTMIVRAALERRLISQEEIEPGQMHPGDAFIINKLNAEETRLCTLPVIFKDEVVGAMALQFPDQKPFAPSMTYTINSIANQLAVAIHSCKTG